MLDATFVDGPRGRLLCVQRLPSGSEPRHTVMVVPAFGDEMNKSRRMVTEVAKRLNEAGVAVLIPDLFGTGDSEGTFVEATWRGWVDDLVAVGAWAAGRGLNVTKLLAIRTGAILAAQFVREYGAISSSIFWQPVKVGQTFVKQMLRLRTMSSAVNSGVTESVEDLSARISAGEVIVAGGYELTRDIVGPLAEADIDALASLRLGRIDIVDVTRINEQCGEFSTTLGEVRAQGVRFSGEPYWMAVETVCDLNIVSETVARLGSGA